jgi:hypothetical protein
MTTKQNKELIATCETILSVCRKIDSDNKRRHLLVLSLFDDYMQKPSIRDICGRERVRNKIDAATRRLNRMVSDLSDLKTELIKQLLEI